MTRGKLVIVLPDGGYKSAEYNGDMYMNQDEYGPTAPISPGDVSRKEIEKPTDLESYKEMVRNFTKWYYGPEYAKCKLSDEEFEHESTIYPIKSPAIDEELGIHFSDYFTHWFSDYIYLKNASGKQIKIYTREGEDVLLDDGQSEVFVFGRKYETPKDED